MNWQLTQSLGLVAHRRYCDGEIRGKSYANQFPLTNTMVFTLMVYGHGLNNELIEKSPEDVFKRLASFLATVEGGKMEQIQPATEIRGKHRKSDDF